MSHTWGSLILIVVFVALVAANVVILIDDFASQKRDDEQSEQIQRLLGGLGFGPAADLSVCPFSFDPRLACRCAADEGPIPGASWFCPRHACSIFYYPPMEAKAESVHLRADGERR